jgi:hypothetical protein
MLKINQNGQKYCVRPEEYGGTSREYWSDAENKSERAWNIVANVKNVVK